MFLGGMKAAFVTPPSPGPWRARCLDSAVESRVWLTSTRTYIANSLHGPDTFILRGGVEIIKRHQQQQYLAKIVSLVVDGKEGESRNQSFDSFFLGF